MYWYICNSRFFILENCLSDENGKNRNDNVFDTIFRQVTLGGKRYVCFSSVPFATVPPLTARLVALPCLASLGQLPEHVRRAAMEASSDEGDTDEEGEGTGKFAAGWGKNRCGPRLPLGGSKHSSALRVNLLIRRTMVAREEAVTHTHTYPCTRQKPGPSIAAYPRLDTCTVVGGLAGSHL